MAQNLEALVHYPEEYYEGLDKMGIYGYYSYLDQRAADVRQAFDSFEFCGDKASDVKVLAIGTADGTLDIPIIDVLTGKYSRIKYYVVEPVGSEVDKFQALTTSKQGQDLWKNAIFEFHPVTIEEYLEKVKGGAVPNNYDIIHTQHSAYHFADPEGTFADLYGLLNKGGMLFNMMIVGAWERIYLRFGNIIPDPMQPNLGSATLREMIQRRVPDVQIKTKSRPISFKADECFKEDSRDGNLMLDFLVQLRNFRKNAPKETVEEFMTFLEELCYKVDNERYFPADDEDIIIVK